MDKFSYAIGLGIGQNLSSMGIQGLAVDDFAQAIRDVLEGNQTAISHNEAREIVNKYFEELEAKMSAVAIEQGKAFLEENKKIATEIIEKSLKIKQAREAARKAREEIRKGKSKNSKEKNLSGKFVPAGGKDKTKNELFLVRINSNWCPYSSGITTIISNKLQVVITTN